MKCGPYFCFVNVRVGYSKKQKHIMYGLHRYLSKAQSDLQFPFKQITWDYFWSDKASRWNRDLWSKGISLILAYL